MVLFLHQPPSWFKMHWPKYSFFEGLRALICLSEEQKAYFEGVSATPAIRIPHGVCHDFFTPSDVPQNNAPELLFVGQWLRDFETLYAAMQSIWKNRDDVILNCVIPGSVRSRADLMELAKDERVIWHEGIPPESLRQLYRKATLLFLPLIDCVANNAILEAMACGLPIVSTDIGGIRDYVNDECAVLCKPADVTAHVSAVLHVLDDKKFRDDAGRKSRARVEKYFDWNAIANLLIEKLEALPE